MKKYLIVLMALASMSFAVLPPFYQTSEEIEAILDSDELASAFGSGEPIMEIKRVEEGYLVKGNRYQITVKIKYIPTDRLGPAKFELSFEEPVSIEHSQNIDY
jgi:hypothetical protein